MTTFLYLIWFGLPSIFFVMAFVAQLEVWSGKSNRGEAGTYLRQGCFVLACSLLALAIDQWFLEDWVNMFLDPYVPLILAQIILFPIILLLGAKLVGGTRPVQIGSKRVSRNQKGKRR